MFEFFVLITLTNFANMSSKKIDKKSAVKLIVSSLKKGIDKKSIFDNLLQSFTITRQSVNTYYNEAEKQFLEFRAKVEPIEIQKTAELEAESGILSKAQALKILSDLAMTAERDSDKVAAVKTMADFQGWKAIVKPEPIETPEEITEIKITRIGSKS